MSVEQYIQPKPERLIPETMVSSRVLKDFYFSFRFSQGTNTLQYMYFSYLNWYYRTRFPAEGTTVIDRCLVDGRLRERATKFRLPPNHSIVTNNIESTFTAMFSKFEEALAITCPVAIGDEQIVAMVDAIASDDYGYQWEFQARPNTGAVDGFDVHHSLLREHILKREPTGSDAYDCLFSTIADRMAAKPRIFLHDKTMLSYLPECWENVHPGESFYPTPTVL